MDSTSTTNSACTSYAMDTDRMARPLNRYNSSCIESIPYKISRENLREVSMFWKRRKTDWLDDLEMPKLLCHLTARGLKQITIGKDLAKELVWWQMNKPFSNKSYSDMLKELDGSYLYGVQIHVES